jgi:integrase-like protein
VFASVMGTSLDAQNIVNRYFKPLLKLTGLTDIRWHDLRHTCATMLLGRRMYLKLVQHLLRHASIAMTLDRYSHWIPCRGRPAADTVWMKRLGNLNPTADVLLTIPLVRTTEDSWFVLFAGKKKSRGADSNP